ncbi:MAG: hypothetical protein ACXWDF_08635 [Aeromicrobium sp.]
MAFPNLGTDSLTVFVNDRKGSSLIILGVILLVLGALLSIPILYTIGDVLVVVGAILWILGSMDRGIGGRRHYY